MHLAYKGRHKNKLYTLRNIHGQDHFLISWHENYQDDLTKEEWIPCAVRNGYVITNKPLTQKTMFGNPSKKDLQRQVDQLHACVKRLQKEVFEDEKEDNSSVCSFYHHKFGIRIPVTIAPTLKGEQQKTLDRLELLEEFLKVEHCEEVTATEPPRYKYKKRNYKKRK